MVDTHYNLTKPSLLAGKDVYVEWPLATSTAEAEELAELASYKNSRTIVGTQVYESFLHIFGEFSTFSSILENKYNTVALVDMNTGQVVDPAYPRTSPDQVLLQGILKSGAVDSVSARMSNIMTVDSIGYRWILTGTEGEIEVIAPYAQWQGSPAGKKIKVFPDFGKNVAAVYRAFAEGRKEDYADFAEAMVLHRLLDNYAAAAENKTTEK
ncbi:hypothetical protein BP5796_02805 [Coleophoma crateriformis]|uniref:Uncharacterized protein n=1 Tax=Coleophoma crateriformis TaxID=565419 RepID=A0A3D8SZD0_9HELO|nr:hypothetical protein BP5796_02805 [Coleophoma crateriformis]